jgi:hypothetical protein
MNKTPFFEFDMDSTSWAADLLKLIKTANHEGVLETCFRFELSLRYFPLNDFMVI